MSSDPSPAATPPPPAGGGGALPLQIGKAFIKQYYKTLVNTPAQLNRFYQPDSTVSRGMEPSAPTSPSSVAEVTGPTNGEETTPGERVRKTFFEWAGKGIDEGGEDADDILRIELQGGAIDAQESVGGGILLVVTGHMFLPGKSHSKAYSFVHTFFLNNGAPPGRKKQFYVKNDILRFLEPVVDDEEEDEAMGEDGVAVEAAEEEPEVAKVAEPSPETEAEQPSPESVDAPVEVTEAATVSAIEPVEYEPAADEEKVEVVDDEDDDIEEVQEEIGQIAIEEEPAADEEKLDASTSSDESPPSSPSSEGKKKRRRRRGGKSRSRSNSPPNGSGETEEGKEEEQAKPPSSWANLVASGATKKSESVTESKKGSKSKGSSKSDEKTSTTKAAPAKAPPQSQPPSKESASQTHATQNKRTPEATLFIRNIPDPTKEEEIRALFEPHGIATGNKILGITLNTNRGYCFVDFDGQAAVDAIVDEAKSSLVKDPRTGRKDKSSFMAHGRVLDVERKVPGDRKGSGGNAGGGGGKYNRSNSPKDSGRRYGSRGSRGGGGGGGGGGGSRRSPSRGGTR